MDNKKILIVDDEPDVVKILGIRLKANGYYVIAADNGAQAVEFARHKKPDLIILDIKLPDKDGYAVFEELKACAETTSIPVIFFSALQPTQVEEKAAQLGADGFISKSADPNEILVKIKEILK